MNKQTLRLAAFAAVLQMANPATASAATPAASAPAAAPAPAASGPGAFGRRERPIQSPAVRAAQDAGSPGDLRPKNPVVPQLSVPLRARHSERAASGTSPGGDIDDSAARCRAAASAREREACTRGGSVPGSRRQ